MEFTPQRRGGAEARQQEGFSLRLSASAVTPGNDMSGQNRPAKWLITARGGPALQSGKVNNLLMFNDLYARRGLEAKMP